MQKEKAVVEGLPVSTELSFTAKRNWQEIQQELVSLTLPHVADWRKWTGGFSSETAVLSFSASVATIRCFVPPQFGWAMKPPCPWYIHFYLLTEKDLKSSSTS